MGKANMKSNHALFVPFPAQGHIRPMFHLAQILHAKGFHITFLNTEHNQRQILKSSGTGDGGVGNRPSFRFVTIADGLPPPENPDAPHDAFSMLSFIGNLMDQALDRPFKELLTKLQNEAASSPGTAPPLTCLIADVTMRFSVPIAKEFGLTTVLMEGASLCSFRGYIHYRWLVDNDYVPLKDSSCLTNGYLERPIDSIPSMKGIQLKDIPTFIRVTNLDNMMLNAVMGTHEEALRTSPVIFNTFDALEQEVLDDLSAISPGIFTIGPLHLLAGHLEEPSNPSRIRATLWKEEPECLKWLASQEPNSVIYINFGSVAFMSRDQLAEFAWGIANSGHKFLWIIRSDLVLLDDYRETALPDEFLVETKGRGVVASWCDQERVLNNAATKGFLTHCGWNSTLESIACGVPMLCWPAVADQVTNSWFCCRKLGIGIELSKFVKRDELERSIRELMEKEKGEEMKRKAIELRSLAQEAILGPGGSSHRNLEKLISYLGGR